MSDMNTLGWTFNTEAEKYAKIRPGYVKELYNDIFQMVDINSQSNVIEIGIGGGQATLPILETGCKITAVEYGDKLAALCCEKFKDYSKFSAIVGKFEDVDLNTNAYDLVYSASAFHWVPEEIGYRKVFQILKSNGVFARFSNHPYKDKENEELDQAIQELYKIYLPEVKLKGEFTEQNAKNLAENARKYGFCDISYHLYHRTRTFTGKEYIELLGTYSDHIALEESIRYRFFSEIQNVIEKYGGKINVYDTIDLELARKP